MLVCSRATSTTGIKGDYRPAGWPLDNKRGIAGRVAEHRFPGVKAAVPVGVAPSHDSPTPVAVAATPVRAATDASALTVADGLASGKIQKSNELVVGGSHPV
ncbi:hypothetical protein XFF7766_170007 [Xanthomonas citri pv. fuscans]|nr:hypothetical protein XFF6960_140007 [Xanthomonas citri pv. fuscans]SOO13359.1 hypothetical protein XFF7766_170007 [Xanthomonas citri pv. fuscans]